MSDLANCFQEVPQVLINCRVKERKKLEEIKGYTQFLSQKEALLKNEGRYDALTAVFLINNDLVGAREYALLHFEE